ncbi:tRNA:m(4)X modification enzyme TRM13 homolog isoform X2 [Amphibalanus amphitrite]|nr:tRNA:m(4)X modification enzyme TRM13 homolog isoform X2 [Amphibalanus amphitrite]XP_043230108.1 tRNA:m(4)X modification enzyme TRM13 homolog isoform X2 [Amphibalanus amphitrite]
MMMVQEEEVPKDLSTIRRKCKFVVPIKNRPCRMLALDGEVFCGEHIVLDTEYLSQKEVPEDRLRIKCPLDPRHTCYLKKLQKHLKVCNAREKERPPYYVRDINAGDRSAGPGGPTIHELSDQALLDLLDKISALHSEHVSPPEVAEEAAHEALSESLQNPAFGADTLKHLRQNSSLLAVLRDAGLLQPHDATFVDLGSGKAQLSFWLARAVSGRSQIVLVDFASHRHKAENKLKDVPGAPEVQRLKLDIRHLSLAGCEACRGRPVVTIGKHLCGAATDLGIRAATVAPSDVHRTPAGVGQDRAAVSANTQTGDQSGPQTGDQTGPQTVDQSGPPAADRTDESGEPTAADVRGIMIAVCCHHRVDWPSYVGKQFIQDVCGFSAADFAALKGVAAWATCGTPGWDPERPSNRRGQHEAPRKRRYKPAEPADKRPRLEGAAPGTGPAGQPGQGSSDQSESAPFDQTESAAADQTESSTTDPPGPQPTDQPGPEPANGPGPEAGDQPGLEPADKPGPGSRDASAGRYQRLGLSPERRTAVGFQCKRLLDEGRRRYLESRGFCARLVRYVPPAVSPENVLLLATR